MMTQHPAKFSSTVLDAITVAITSEHCLDEPIRLLDPFAGVGYIHRVGVAETVGLELEPEWAAMAKLFPTVVGNALSLPFADSTFNVIATSPTYGNRMADHHDAQDGSRRYTYRHSLGRMPSDDSSAVMQWGDEYREFHGKAWSEAYRVLKPYGLFIVNISNHIRQFSEQLVSEWHLAYLLWLGCKLEYADKVMTPRNRHGENGYSRVDGERLLVMRKV